MGSGSSVLTKKKEKRPRVGKLLEETTLSELCDQQTIETIRDNATVDQCLKVGS